MTNQEFSMEFELLYNNIMSNLAPGLDEYEKSVFLTQAQEQLIQAVYNGATDTTFEEVESNRRFLDELVQTATLQQSSSSIVPIDGQIYALPEDIWFIILEKFNPEEGCYSSTGVDVIPITHDEYLKIKRNPFRNSSNHRYLRMDAGRENDISYVELIAPNYNGEYVIRYIKKPSPIILANLGNESIDGVSIETPCKLNEGVHRTILTAAVKLASEVYKSK